MFSSADSHVGSANQKILSLSGLKVIAMFLIFWWHSDLEKPPVDLGARACEFFFVAAGFLYFYAHRSRPVACTPRGMYGYVSRKISAIWPIHFLAFLLTLLYIKPAQWLSKDGALLAALNLSLTHAFVNNAAVYHSFNGVSWFCSAIIFCYAAAPILARMLRNLRRAPLFLVVSFAMRYMIEWVQTVKPGEYWNVSLHVFPPVRLLEFLMGMAVAALFLYVREKPAKQPHFILCSLLETGTLALTAALMIGKQNEWLRAAFLLPFSLLIFVFAFDGGLFSRLFAVRPVQFFASLQLEFFVLHQVMFRLIQRFYPTLYAYPKREFLVCLILTTGAALLYRCFIQKPFSSLVRRALDRLYQLC